MIGRGEKSSASPRLGGFPITRFLPPAGEAQKIREPEGAREEDFGVSMRDLKSSERTSIMGFADNRQTVILQFKDGGVGGLVALIRLPFDPTIH